jgi:hypothetical protein
MRDEAVRVPESTWPVVALDSTKLISADSFFFDEPFLKDPRALPDFQGVATLFCNESAPFFVSPPSAKEQPHATELLKMWQRVADKNVVPVKLDKDAIQAEMAPIFVEEFRDPGKAGDLKQWLKFQLSNPTLVDIFWEGGNEPRHLREALQHLDPILDQEHPLSSMTSQLDMQLDGHFFEEGGATSREAVLKAYAFLAFEKGREYIYKLPDGPNYRSHWLRLAAQPKKDEKESAVIGEMPPTFFPWGELITDLMLEPTCMFRPSSRTVAELLTTLRDARLDGKPYQEVNISDFEEIMATESEGKQKRAELADAVLSKVEVFVVEALDKIGYALPKQYETFWLEHIVPILFKYAWSVAKGEMQRRGVPQYETGSANPLIEKVSYWLQRGVIKSEFAGRRIFNRLIPGLNALDVYVSEPIRESSKKYAERVRRASAAGSTSA